LSIKSVLGVAVILGLTCVHVQAGPKTLPDANLVCSSKDVRYRIAELMAHDDRQAAMTLYRTSGCQIIPAGTIVDVEDWSVIGPLTLDCLRPRGVPNCYWGIH
jgi:hypothetical protein